MSGRWTGDFTLIADGNQGITFGQYYGRAVFATREEAKLEDFVPRKSQNRSDPDTIVVPRHRYPRICSTAHQPFWADGDAIFWEGRNPWPVPMVLVSGIRLIARIDGELLTMWYGNTKNLLESIVRGLRTEAPQNDAEWQAQTDLVQACLAGWRNCRNLLPIRRRGQRPDTFTVRLRIS